MKQHIQRLSRLAVLGMSFLILFADAAFAVRPTVYGFALAYPRQTLPFTEQNFPPLTKEKHVMMEWGIDAKGKVQSVTATNPADSLFVMAISQSCTVLPFEAAMLNGKAVDSRLLVAIRMLPNYPYPFFTFPVDSTPTIIDQSLYTRSIESNEIELPRIRYFPPYWSSLRISDTVAVPPLILLRTAIDKDGRITDLRSVHSTFPAFTTQLIAAATRAVVTPAKIKGKTVAVSAYFCLIFFPGNNYPTQPYFADSVQPLPLRERVQLMLVPDTNGLLLSPIPRFSAAEALGGGDEVRGMRDTIAVSFTIDSLGEASCIRHDDVSQAVSKWIQKTANWMQFYPAVDFEGNTHPFSGTAYFIFSDSTSVRIHYPWLD